MGIGYYMAHQHGLVLRRQALASGLSPEHVQRLVRRGEWVVVRRGVYTTRAHWESLDPYVGRPQLEVWAATSTTMSPHLVSHDSAAYLHRLPILEARPRLVHITRIGALGGRTRFGIKHHKAPTAVEHIVFVDDHPVLDIPRTVADIAREHGVRHGIVAAGSALRLGVSKRAMWSAIEPMRCWPFVTWARAAVQLADARCENPGEDLTKLMLEELGLGVVHPQFGLQDRGRVAWADFRVGRHLVEFDGRHKYQRETGRGLRRRPCRGRRVAGEAAPGLAVRVQARDVARGVVRGPARHLGGDEAEAVARGHRHEHAVRDLDRRPRAVRRPSPAVRRTAV